MAVNLEPTCWDQHFPPEVFVITDEELVLNEIRRKLNIPEPSVLRKDREYWIHKQNGFTAYAAFNMRWHEIRELEQEAALEVCRALHAHAPYLLWRPVNRDGEFAANDYGYPTAYSTVEQLCKEAGPSYYPKPSPATV